MMLSRISKMGVFGIVALMLALGLTADDAFAQVSKELSLTEPTAQIAATSVNTITFSLAVGGQVDAGAGNNPPQTPASTVMITIPHEWPTQPIEANSATADEAGEVTFAQDGARPGRETGRVSGRNLIISIRAGLAGNGTYVATYFNAIAPARRGMYRFPLSGATIAATGSNLPVDVGYANSGTGTIALTSHTPLLIVRGGRLALYKNPSGTLEPGESVTFTIEVTEDGNAVPGQTVTFSLNPDDGSASLSTTSATTDSNGQAQTTLTLGSNPASGYAVSATDGVAQVSGTVRTTTPRTPPSHPLVLNADRDNLNVQPGDTVTFTAEVRENGNPVSGQTVTFRVDPDDGGVSLSTTSATTDSNGQAQTTLTTGSDSSRAYWVVAAIGNKSVARLLNVAIPLPPPPPRNLSMVVIHSPGSADPGKTMTFIVEVQEDGSPVSTDETVTFSITSGDGNAWLGYWGTDTTRSGSTGSNGRAATTIRLGKKASRFIHGHSVGWQRIRERDSVS